MTTLVVHNRSPPRYIISDARRIANSAVSRQVTLENAIDDDWFILIEGDARENGEFYKTKREFKDFAKMVRSIINTDNVEFKTFYGIGRSEDRWLIRIEYKQ